MKMEKGMPDSVNHQAQKRDQKSPSRWRRGGSWIDAQHFYSILTLRSQSS